MQRIDVECNGKSVEEKTFPRYLCFHVLPALHFTQIAFCLHRVQASSQKISFLYGHTNLACQSPETHLFEKEIFFSLYHS